MNDVVTAYYNDTTSDYLAWSPAGNMHFGYWRRGLSLIDAEPMIERMNHEVVERMRLTHGARVADLGCGLGATSRFLAARGHRTVGVTLVPMQAHRASTMATSQDPPRFVAADYTRLPFAASSFDGAMCLESACHAAGADKRALVDEAARVLKPGARFVVADAFLKRRPLSPLTRAARRVLEDLWAVPEFASLSGFLTALAGAGFEDVRVDDVSWRVAPTVLRAPIVSARFLVEELIRRRNRLTPWRFKNALACAPLLLAIADRTAFAYCIITATRRGRA